SASNTRPKLAPSRPFLRDTRRDEGSNECSVVDGATVCCTDATTPHTPPFAPRSAVGCHSNAMLAWPPRQDGRLQQERNRTHEDRTWLRPRPRLKSATCINATVRLRYSKVFR